MTTQQLLDELAEYYAQRDALNLQKQEAIDTVLTPEIKQEIADIEYEFRMKAEAAEFNIAHLEDQIKAEVKAGGASVKGTHLMAVFNKGRVTWDNKALEGIAMVIPQVAQARKEGEPFVSFKKAGKE